MIFESSITGLFRFLLIAFLAYSVFTLLVRYILPTLLRKTIHNFYKGYHEDNIRPKVNKPSKDGEVTIEYIDKQTNRSGNNAEDEYIDYEEIK